MTAKVIEFGGVTRLDIDPSKVLKAATEADLQSVTVIGADPEGNFYFASSFAGAPEVICDLELAKIKLLHIILDMGA